MKKAKVFMDDFMNKLRADDYEKDNQPNKGRQSSLNKSNALIPIKSLIYTE